MKGKGRKPFLLGFCASGCNILVQECQLILNYALG